MKDSNTIAADMWQEEQERVQEAYQRAFPAMVEAAKKEVDQSIMTDDDIYNECLHDALDLEEIRIALFHGDAEELGKTIIHKTRTALFEYHVERIENDWQKYVE